MNKGLAKGISDLINKNKYKIITIDISHINNDHAGVSLIPFYVEKGPEYDENRNMR